MASFIRVLKEYQEIQRITLPEEEFLFIPDARESRSPLARKVKLHREIIEELEITRFAIRRIARLSGVEASEVEGCLSAFREDFIPYALNALERAIQTFYRDVRKKAFQAFKTNRQHKRAMALPLEKTQNRLPEVVRIILPFIRHWGATFNCHHIEKSEDVFFIERSIIDFTLEALRNYARPNHDAFFRDYYLNEELKAWLVSLTPGQFANKRQLQQATLARKRALEQKLPADVISTVLRQALDKDLPALLASEIEKTLRGKFLGWARSLCHHSPLPMQVIGHSIATVISAFREIFKEAIAEVRRSPSVFPQHIVDSHRAKKNNNLPSDETFANGD